MEAMARALIRAPTPRAERSSPFVFASPPKTFTAQAGVSVAYDAAIRQSVVGRDEAADAWRELKLASSDGTLELRDCYVAGDVAVLEVTFAGTHDGPFAGRAPTGSPISVDACIVFEVTNGEIARQTMYLDAATILRSAGLLKLPRRRSKAA